MLIQPRALPVTALCDIWSALHAGIAPTISAAERHYLRMLALAIDDDLISALLLRKLRHARIVADGPAPGAARLDSLVEYRIGAAPPQHARLVHAAARAGEVAVATPVGAALIGLSAGQALFWPLGNDTLDEIRVLGVSGPAASLRGTRGA